MTADQSKQLVMKTWEAMYKGDIKTVLGNMSDDVTWTVPGDFPELSGVRKGKQALIEFFGGVGRNFPEGLKSEIHELHAAGDHVIIELTNRGKAANGRLYANEYCFVVKVTDGRISQIREYLDTQKAKNILYG